MKKTRKTHVTHKAHHDALKSPIMQVGVVFFMVMAFAVLAWAFKYYTP